MSLRVWLPLNGTLDNQGLSNVTVTNNGATVDNNGKIGKCYYFTPNQWIKISLPAEMITIKNTTIAAWVKSHSTTMALGGISHDGAATLAGITLYSSGWQLSGGGNWKYINGGTIANTQVWHHVACTIGDDEIITYLDGIKVTSSTLTAQAITNTTLTSTDNFIEIGCDHPGGDEYFTGYVNDFRIYDHALSAKEVKELSKSLVLHYKLDKINGGNANLLTNSIGDFTGTVPTSSYTDFKTWNSVAIVSAGEKYTASFEAKSSVNGVKLTSYFYNNASGIVQVASGINNQGITTTAADGGIATTLTTNYQRYWVTWTFNSTTTSAAKTFILGRLVYGNNTDKTGATVTVKNVKLEKGDKSTPWTPNSTDTAYTALGYNQAIEYDCSGYGHNGDIIGTISSTTGSPRYNNNIHISATNQKIHTSGLTTSGFGNSYSFSWWAKCSTWSNMMHWGFSDGIRLNGIYNGNLWNTGDGSNNPLYNIGATTQVTAPSVNEWHHFVMTGNGSKCYVYKDGVLWAEAKTYKAISGTSIYINGWDSSTSYSNTNLDISDFRIYATALSADDVKELYQTAASIDNYGNVHTYEVVE